MADATDGSAGANADEEGTPTWMLLIGMTIGLVVFAVAAQSLQGDPIVLAVLAFAMLSAAAGIVFGRRLGRRL
jgi:hypothetical protein